MSKWMMLLALGAAIMLSSFASAKDKGAATGPHGKVSAVTKDKDGKVTSITIAPGKKNPDAKETVIKADDSAKVTKDDQPGTLADVTVGSFISVTQDADGKVQAIAVRTKKKKTT